jgi:uncharacterized protein (TIGR02246 family)
MEGFMEALNALDVERMAQFFADDITAFVPSAQPERAEGKAAVVAIFRRYVETTRATTTRTHLVPEDLRIDVQGETAVVSFHVRSAEAVARRTFIFREEDGRWLICHFHASSFPIRRVLLKDSSYIRSTPTSPHR